MKIHSFLSFLVSACLAFGLFAACNSTSEVTLAEDGDRDSALDGDADSTPGDGDENAETESNETEETDEADTSPFTLPADFFSDGATDVLKLTVRGLINTKADYDANKGTTALGKAELTLSGESTTVEESVTVHPTVIPTDYSVVDMRNKEYVLIDAFNTLESSSSGAHYRLVGIGIAREALLAIKSSGQPLAKVPSYTWSNVYDVTLRQRTDNTLFRKYCVLSKGDYGNPEQAVFLDFRANNDFQSGENLILYASIRLLPKNVITDENEEQFCSYYQNSDVISKEVYDRESVKDGTELDCTPPEGYLTLTGENATVFQIKGPINDFNDVNATLQSGLGFVKTKLAGQNRNLADYRFMAGRYVSDPVDLIYLHAMGEVAQKGANHYTFTLMEVFTSRAALIDLPDSETLLKNESTTYKDEAGLLFYAAISENEEKIIGTDDYMKTCPKALTDLSQSANSLFVCRPKPNPEFMPKEELQMAGSFAWTTDPQIINDFYKYEGGCSCTKNSTVTIACADFDALSAN